MSDGGGVTIVRYWVMKWKSGFKLSCRPLKVANEAGDSMMCHVGDKIVSLPV